jgi:nitroreductase
MLKDLILKSRSYRRFDQSYAVDRATLRDLVDLARLSPSGMNMQSLKYVLSAEPELNARIFPRWGGRLISESGPARQRANVPPHILSFWAIRPFKGILAAITGLRRRVSCSAQRRRDWGAA